MSGDMQESLLGCFSDMSICIVGWFCPWYINATAKAQLDNRDCTFCDCICQPNPYQTRQSLRKKYGISLMECNDCLAFYFCPYCFICQNAREIRAHPNDK